MEDTHPEKEMDSEESKQASEVLKRLDLFNKRRQSLHPSQLRRQSVHPSQLRKQSLHPNQLRKQSLHPSQLRRLSGLEESSIEIPMLLDGWVCVRNVRILSNSF